MRNQLSHEQEERERHRTNQLFSSHPIYAKHRAISRLFEVAKNEKLLERIENTIGQSCKNNLIIAPGENVGFQLFERHWWNAPHVAEYYYKWQFYIVDHFNRSKAKDILTFMKKERTNWNYLFEYLRYQIGTAQVLESINWLLQSDFIEAEITQELADILHHHLLVLYSNVPHTGIMLSDIWKHFYLEPANEIFLQEKGSPVAFYVKVKTQKENAKNDLPPFKYHPVLAEPVSDLDNFTEILTQSPTSYYTDEQNVYNLMSVQKLFEKYLYPLFYNPSFRGDWYTDTLEVQRDLRITGYLFFPIYEFLIGERLYGAHLGWIQAIIGLRHGTSFSYDNFLADPSENEFNELVRICQTFQIHLNECVTETLLHGIETDVLREAFDVRTSTKEFVAKHIYLLGGWECDEIDREPYKEENVAIEIYENGNADIDLSYDWPPTSTKETYNFLYMNKKADTLLPKLATLTTDIMAIWKALLFDRIVGFYNRTKHISYKLIELGD